MTHAPPQPAHDSLPANATRVQAKPVLGRAGDRFEQEADRIADTVTAERPTPLTAPLPVTPLIQRQTDEPGTDDRQSMATATAAAAIATGGRPLSPAERRFFEPRFGRDLSAVRLHEGTQAGAAARGIGARAYTLGQNIALAPGEYAPETREGRHLLAHELTHTLQQSGDPAHMPIRRLPQGQSGSATGNRSAGTPASNPAHMRFLEAREEMCRRSDTSALLERIDRDNVEIRLFRTATDRWRLADGTEQDEDLSSRLRGNLFVDPATGRGIIRINERLSARDMVQTLFHEMQHWIHRQTQGGPTGLESEIQARIATEQMAIDRGWPETAPGYRTPDGRVDEAFIRSQIQASPHYNPQGRTRVPGGRRYGGETTIPGPFACPPVGDFPTPRRDIAYA
ncbi:eCIS core domain-containing protein [Rhodovulum strictum]|nr:DUF4157 domain-containing protein [Rhodovulum strictum]